MREGGGGGRRGGREGGRGGRGGEECFGRRGTGETKGSNFVAHVLAFLLDGGLGGSARVGELTLHAFPEGSDGEGGLKGRGLEQEGGREGREEGSEG